MKKYLLLSLLGMAASAHAITDGQWSVSVYNGTGFTTTYVTMVDGQVIGKTSGLPAAITPFDGVFSSLTSKPTTLSGYGITNGQTLTGTLALAGFGSITGTIPAANGGSGQTSLQASINALAAASGALNQGDIFYYNGTNFVRLAAGTDGQYLKTQGAGANPLWASVPTGLTIGTTAVTGAASGDILTSDGSLLQKLTPGSGISTWLTTPTEANLKSAQSGLAWLDTAQTFTAAQTVHAGVAYGDTIARFEDHTGRGLTIRDSTSSDFGGAYVGTPILAFDYDQFFIKGELYLISSSAKIYLSQASIGTSGAGVVYEVGGGTALAGTHFRLGSDATYQGNFVIHSGDNTAVTTITPAGNISTAGTITANGGLTVGSSGTAIAHIKRYSVTLVAGTATVSDTDITANTQVLISVLTPGGVVGSLDFDVSAGSSFTVNSSSAADTSTIICTVIIY